MNWPADKEACYGVCCPKHAACARYHAIDNNTNQQQVWMDNCGPERSAFIAIVPVPAEKAPA